MSILTARAHGSSDFHAFTNRSDLQGKVHFRMLIHFQADSVANFSAKPLTGDAALHLQNS